MAGQATPAPDDRAAGTLAAAPLPPLLLLLELASASAAACRPRISAERVASSLDRAATSAVTSGFGYRWGALHAGIDIANGTGTPIRAAKAGTIILAGWNGGYGNCIVIDHGGGFSTLYGHMSRLRASEGQQVGQGDLIGDMGSTGNSTGSHLHFETRVNGSPQDPMKYLP